MSDSDASVIFKRKSKPVQRSRQTSPGAEPGAESPSTLASKLKKKTKPKSRLSFGGDDEEGDGEVFQLKKSSLSRKLASGKRPSSPGDILSSSLDQASISSRSNGGPTYDSAYLSELKASTPSSRRPLLSDVSYDADISMDVGDLSIQSIQSVDVFADSEVSIPSESSIFVAKQKRERLRSAGSTGEEDFISLSITRRDDEPKGPHPASRLMREEDEIGDGDDEFAEYTSAQERIALGKKSKKLEAQKLRDSRHEMIADAEEEDEETTEWEQEQLRRGGHMPATDSIPIKQSYKAAPIPPATPIPTLGPAIARLTQSLTELTTSHTKNQTSMTSLAEERSHLDEREAELREMIGKAEAKRSWFVTFKEWIESVATFLDEKFPQLEKLEDEHVSIISGRSVMISQRRHADDEDDLSFCFGSLPPIRPEVEEPDNLGRTIANANPTAARTSRRASRVARRSRRRAMYAQTNNDAEEGYSTDSSLPPSDSKDYDTTIRQLKSDSKDILSDVRAIDFEDPSQGVEKWFGEWRDQFAESYTGAWGGLGLVGAWEFWVRLELVGWNPLDDTRSLDSFIWYSALYKYSRPRLEGEEDPDLGPDGDLVSEMISTTVIPRLCKILAGGACDPYSTKSIRGILNLAEQVEALVERGSVRFQMLLKSVQMSFQSLVNETEELVSRYLAVNNPRFDPEAIPARRRFLARRMKLLQNIVQWRKYSGEKSGVSELCTKLLMNCMVPVAESGWEVGGEEYIRKAANLLSHDLIPYSLKARLKMA